MSYMIVLSGKKVDLLEPNASQISIKDIAVSLSRQCRFNGHSVRFYSVAEHSIRMSNEMPWAFKLQALLHDAAEAYVGDLISPIKWELPKFKKMEDRIYSVIAEKYQLPLKIQDTIKEADMRMLATEKRDLMPQCEDWDFLRNVEPFSFTIDMKVGDNFFGDMNDTADAFIRQFSMLMTNKK